MTSRRVSFSGIRISSATSRETSHGYSSTRWSPAGRPAASRARTPAGPAAAGPAAAGPAAAGPAGYGPAAIGPGPPMESPSGEPPSAGATGSSAGTVVPRFTRPILPGNTGGVAAGAGRRGGSGDRDAAVGHPGHRVDRPAVLPADPHLEVQVRAGAVAERPDQADELARLDPLADPDQHLLLVAVEGHVAVRVLDDDRVAVAPLGAGVDDDPVAGRVERGAPRSGHVLAVVERAPAPAEAGRDDVAAAPHRVHPLRPGRLDQGDLAALGLPGGPDVGQPALRLGRGQQLVAGHRLLRGHVIGERVRPADAEHLLRHRGV